MNKNIFVIISALIATSLYLIEECQARHHNHHQHEHRSGKRSDALNRACQGDECSLKAEHFALYSTIKMALDSNFDIKGKELYPFLNSVELLKLRYDGNDANLLASNNGTRLVRELLVSNELRRALKIIQSSSGRSLADIYRTPTNGNEQNLACNKLRIDDIERASKMMEMDKDLSSIFANIHRNFVRKSAKKCLKKACTSIDDSMSRLDSMVNRRTSNFHNHRHHHHNRESHNRQSPSTNDNPSFDVEFNERNPRLTDSTGNRDSDLEFNSREFAKQELELCNFFKKTNQSDCTISGSELSEISVNKPTQLNELLISYANNKSNATTTPIAISPQNIASSSSNIKEILDQCRPMQSIMEHNLAALKWYNKNEYISKSKYNSRTNNCQKLSYWLQLDRLCADMEMISKNGISSLEKETINY